MPDPPWMTLHDVALRVEQVTGYPTDRDPNFNIDRVAANLYADILQDIANGSRSGKHLAAEALRLEQLR